MQIGVIGCSHKSAELLLREQLAFALPQLLARLAFPYVLLLTCNRVELYFHERSLSELCSHLERLTDTACREALYLRLHKECFFHLACVTSGIESALKGETEIQGQVKKAYEEATRRASLPSELHFVFQKSLKIGKAMRSTLQQMPPLSLDALLLKRATSILGDLKDKHILFVGLSEINMKIFLAFRRSGLTAITFCNRTPSPSPLDAAFLPWEQLDQWGHYDLIICATRAPHFLLKPQKRTYSKKLIVDLSLPRNVDPALAHFPNITLLNVDHFEDTRGVRTKEAEQERLFVQEAVERTYQLFERKQRPALTPLENPLLISAI